MDAETLVAAHRDYRDRLVNAGLLVPIGADGLMGRSAVFENVVLGIGRAVSTEAAPDNESVWHFPPVLPRSIVHRVGYLRSFPDMLGSLHAFTGDDAVHRELLSTVEQGGDYPGFTQSDAVLLPASCYPIYVALEGQTVPATGRCFHTVGTCYRHEPSPDPARLRCFRQHEHVCVGAPDVVDAWALSWHQRAARVLSRLGLEPELVVANDPFFGRAGRLMKAQQHDQALKHELTVAIYSQERQTAVASVNRHHTHFTETFSISTEGSSPAHTACVGFGVERVALAMLHRHGLDPASWPAPVLSALEG